MQCTLTKQVVKKAVFISFLSIEVSLSREDKNNIFDFLPVLVTSVVPCLIFQKNKHQQKSLFWFNGIILIVCLILHNLNNYLYDKPPLYPCPLKKKYDYIISGWTLEMLNIMKADSIDSFVTALFISIVVTAFEFFFSYNHFTDAASFCR